jgi:hypothetical protein
MMEKDTRRDLRAALLEVLGGVSAEGLVFLAIGLVLGAIGAALALRWTRDP